MAGETWTMADTEKARQYCDVYQQHDLAAGQGQTVGIDPASRRMWFGPSAKAIVTHLVAAGLTLSLDFLRIGRDVYLRKGGRRC